MEKFDDTASISVWPEYKMCASIRREKGVKLNNLRRLAWLMVKLYRS